MAVVSFNGDYKLLKTVGFTFHRHYGIKYSYEPKPYHDSIWIIKAGGGMIIDYNLNDFRLQSQLIDFAVENRELIEKMQDYVDGEDEKLDCVRIVFSQGRFEFGYKNDLRSRHYYIRNLKMLLWLHDNGNLTKEETIDDNGNVV